MSLTSDCAPIVRLSGGCGGTVSVGMHSPPRDSRDMNSSQLVPLIDWVASDTTNEERVDTECCEGAVGGVELGLAELGSRTFL